MNERKIIVAIMNVMKIIKAFEIKMGGLHILICVNVTYQSKIMDNVSQSHMTVSVINI